jgi:glutamate synthase (NADPH/NADH) small chain
VAKTPEELRKAGVRQLEKTPMPEQDPEERVHNFREVPYGYTDEMAIAEAWRCLECKDGPCVAGCPVEIDIPAFIRAVKEGDFRTAAGVIKRTNALPAVCGRVCPQEEQCEIVCLRGKKGEPVAIGRLERFVADWEAEHGDPELPEIAPPNGHRAAIIGCGPGGMTCAGDLAVMGYDVTVFEAFHASGGVLRYGIPEFRLPKAIVDRETHYLELLGVKFAYNMVIGKVRTLEELRRDGFEAFYIGTGAGLPWFMKIEGEGLNGVYSANEFLTRANLMGAYDPEHNDTPIWVGKRTAVIGGGNVAMDSARTALRLGSEHVYIVYRRSRVEMPARNEEIHHAEQEGIEFLLLQNPIRILDDGKGWVGGMECIRMELGEPDASGRRRPVPLEGSEFTLDVDCVVVAIGNGPNPLLIEATPGLKVTKWGNIVTDEAGRTSIPGVFAGGDIVTGAATVIEAMGAGKIAARAMDAYVKGDKTWPELEKKD